MLGLEQTRGAGVGGGVGGGGVQTVIIFVLTTGVCVPQNNVNHLEVPGTSYIGKGVCVK